MFSGVSTGQGIANALRSPARGAGTATVLTVVAISLLTGIGEGLGRHLANGGATAVTAVVR